MKRIYADNAGTTQVRQEVVEAMIPYFTDHFALPRRHYDESQVTDQIVEKVKIQIANRLNTEPQYLHFVANGSEANNIAIKHLAYSRRHLGNHLITSAIEHPSVLNTFKALEDEGFEVTYLPVDSKGFISLETLESAIKESTILVSIMMVNNEIGTLQPIEVFSKVLKEKGIAFHVDAIQGLACTEIDIKTLGVTALSLSGHKIYAPKGIALLYFKPFAGEAKLDILASNNIPYIVGLGKAFELNQLEREDRVKRLMTYKQKLVEEIESLDPSIKMNGDMAMGHPGIINLYMPYMDGDSWVINYDMHGIGISSGSACSSGALNASPVLLSIGLNPSDAKKCIRFSLGGFTTEEDVDRIIEVTKIIMNI